MSSEPTYDQQEIITAFTDFYQFLSTLPYIDPALVLTPPSTGWPNITRENFSGLRKNDDVINLLKHLPYLDMSENRLGIAPWTYPTHYCGSGFEIGVSDEDIRGLEPGGDVRFPEWVICMTWGDRDATCIMLDTTDGKDHLSGQSSKR